MNVNKCMVYLMFDICTVKNVAFVSIVPHPVCVLHKPENTILLVVKAHI